VVTPLVLLLAVVGAAWGFVADRVAARWPAHEDGSVRGVDWRTGVVVVVGAVALGGLTIRFQEPVAVATFGVYLVALVLLIATDLDQRLLPNVITLPAIPLALAFGLLGFNPLVPPGAMPVAIVVAIVIPLVLFAISIPFGAGALGQGDVKLLVSVGLMAGAYRMFTGVVYGALLAGVVLVVLLVLHRITLKTYVPFGPFLILGAIWAILAAP
jgi:leader peptidase (prepilin peptidase) / N-methyltransferase